MPQLRHGFCKARRVLFAPDEVVRGIRRENQEFTSGVKVF